MTNNYYENMPIQYKEIGVKKFSRTFFIFFLTFAQNIDCGYTLEPHRRGCSNEYSQSMFWSKNKKNRYTPAKPIFFYIKVGFKGGHVFLMSLLSEYLNFVIFLGFSTVFFAISMVPSNFCFFYMYFWFGEFAQNHQVNKWKQSLNSIPL